MRIELPDGFCHNGGDAKEVVFGVVAGGDEFWLDSDFDICIRRVEYVGERIVEKKHRRY
jgi:hypothetical protein